MIMDIYSDCLMFLELVQHKWIYDVVLGADVYLLLLILPEVVKC